jgi:hypothetical protein
MTGLPVALTLQARHPTASYTLPVPSYVSGDPICVVGDRPYVSGDPPAHREESHG